MASINKVILIGRLGQNPEKRVTQSGSSVVTLSLATSEYFKDAQGNKQERTEWHRVVAWNRQADIIEQYLTKGSQIYIEGRLQTRDWEDKDGNKRYTTEIILQTLQFLDSKSQGQRTNEFAPASSFNAPQAGASLNEMPPSPAPSGNKQFNPPQPEFIEDDIPF